MAKKHYSERKLKFETLQLHVGQESPDPVTDSHSRMPETSTDDLPTLQRTCLREE